MKWLPLLMVSVLLLVFLVPVTPLRERFEVRDIDNNQNLYNPPPGAVIEEPPEDAPAPGLMMNGPKEAEDLHRRDMFERLAKYFEPKLPEDDLVFE
jgi:hypothetical protein